LEIGGKSYWI